MSTHRTDRTAMGLVVAACIAWSLWFIYRTSFVVDGERYFVLFDDAMISMTYARNLVEGFGLNWARWGHPVEGYSCPLWTFAMIPVNALPLDPSKRGLIVQLMGLGFLVATLFAVRRLTVRHLSPPDWSPGYVAVGLTALFYPLSYWTLMGMETGPQALLYTLGVLWTLDVVRDGRERYAGLGWVFGLALVLRPDTALMVGACGLTMLLRGRLRRDNLRRWAPWAGLAVALPLAYLAFRLAYFGGVLPNTYYLKMTGTPTEIRWMRGALVLWDAAKPMLVVLAAGVVGALALGVRQPRFRLPLAVVLLYAAYSVHVGGDAWDFAWSTVDVNRFIAPAMPLFFAIVGGLLNHAMAAARRLPSPLRHPALRHGVTALVGLLCFLDLNGVLGHPKVEERWRNLTVSERPMHVGDRENIVRDIQRLERWVHEDAIVATVWAGAFAYFSDWRLVDLLGYNDAHIAHQPAKRRVSEAEPRRYYPGHMKWDYAYALGRRQPDVVYGYWGPDERGTMERYGYVERGVAWVREGTEDVDRPPE